MKWSNYAKKLHRFLKQTTLTDINGRALDMDDGFDLWLKQTLKLRENTGRFYLIGNGASASMASHFACDVGKNGKVRTEVFFDAGMMTAISNDITYDQVFAHPLRQKMDAGDILVAISSSGNSPNVVEGAKAARDKAGFIVSLTGMKPDNTLRSLGDLNIHVPADTYGMVESAHAVLLHHWMDHLEMATPKTA
ncbi:MAG: SIS domain-containing protein [Magnetococcales bacterium]|nr:SIS domain-containing protein [Magnetococcales bacterium]